MIDIPNYPLDLTAVSPQNLITGEVRKFITDEDRVFIPSGGPFFVRSLVLRDNQNNVELVPNLDFKILHINNDATKASGYSVCSVITVTNFEVSEVNLTYQVIGGMYGQLMPNIYDLLKNYDIHNKVSWFTDVYAKPETYPPAPHFHNGNDFSEWDRISIRLDEIIQAMINKDRYSWQSVYQYIERKVNTALDNVDTNKIANRTKALEDGLVDFIELVQNNYLTEDDYVAGNTELLNLLNGKFSELIDAVNNQNTTFTTNLTSLNDNLNNVKVVQNELVTANQRAEDYLKQIVDKIGNISSGNTGGGTGGVTPRGYSITATPNPLNANTQSVIRFKSANTALNETATVVFQQISMIGGVSTDERFTTTVKLINGEGVLNVRPPYAVYIGDQGMSLLIKDSTGDSGSATFAIAAPSQTSTGGNGGTGGTGGTGNTGGGTPTQTTHTYTISVTPNPVNAGSSSSYRIVSSNPNTNEAVTVSYYQDSSSGGGGGGTVPVHYSTIATIVNGVGVASITPPYPQSVTQFNKMVVSVTNGKGSSGSGTFNISQTQVVTPTTTPYIYLISRPGMTFSYPLKGGEGVCNFKYRSEIYTDGQPNAALTSSYSGSGVTIVADLTVFLTTTSKPVDGASFGVTTRHEMPTVRVTMTGASPEGTVKFNIPDYSEHINGAADYRLSIDGRVVSVNGTNYNAIIIDANFSIAGTSTPSWLQLHG